jgi:hypothetical protein
MSLVGATRQVWFWSLTEIGGSPIRKKLKQKPRASLGYLSDLTGLLKFLSLIYKNETCQVLVVAG